MTSSGLFENRGRVNLKFMDIELFKSLFLDRIVSNTLNGNAVDLTFSCTNIPF